jgi:hypothetical protein
LPSGPRLRSGTRDEITANRPELDGCGGIGGWDGIGV